MTLCAITVPRRSWELSTINMDDFSRPHVVTDSFVLLRAMIHKTWATRGAYFHLKHDTYNILSLYVEHYFPYFFETNDPESDNQTDAGVPLFRAAYSYKGRDARDDPAGPVSLGKAH